MPWRQSTGTERCNDCRKEVDLGAPLYVGELTPAFWCQLCALQMGKSPDGPVPAKLPVAHGLTGLRELVEKFAPKMARSWQERE